MADIEFCGLFVVKGLLEVLIDEGIQFLVAVIAERIVLEGVGIELAVAVQFAADFRKVVPDGPVVIIDPFNKVVMIVDVVYDIVLVVEIAIKVSAADAGLLADFNDSNFVNGGFTDEFFCAACN